jgi:rubrerythrin
MLGEKTKKNLEDAFAGESMARNKYDYYASVARKAGYEQIANFFIETSLNKREHAKLWAKQLELIGDVKENLKHAFEGEHFENSDMYPRMAKEAREEGHEAIAVLFDRVGEVEKHHEARYRKLFTNLETGEVYKKIGPNKWICLNCGHIHEGEEAPLVCPTCSHPQAFFQLLCENY